ncbi:MAG: Stk1 family PASTA domain-containing Ser/Thr kinase [Oscillospiraceae bacterium]|nr:Stk1 family PASTA domain-containing Ser/Thr kinase [Oscillospiraceae bacterium]
MDKYTGKRLDARYEIQELIGVGGMAYVYKAYDIIDDRTVAIKILKEEFLGNQDFQRRFKNESKAIAMLDHPNIVKVYSVSFGDRMQYIVMEYIDGITLKEYMDRQQEVSWKEAIHFVSQILKALHHAHENGIIHRDIKPQNIMLLQDGTIKVTDFGIARFSDSETRTMTDKAIGSVHYIAPEQARGDLTDGKTDVYSVGVMLYEMITGQLPFEADNAVSVAIMQLQTEPKPPREINPAIPVGLEEITLKAMQKDPQKRYQSAREMLIDLEAFRRDPSIQFHYGRGTTVEEPTRVVDTTGAMPMGGAVIQEVDNTASVPPQQTASSARSQTQPVSEVQRYGDNYAYDAYDGEEMEGSPAKKKKTGVIVGVSVAAAAVAAIIGVVLLFVFGVFGGNSGSDEIDLPNFVGQKLSDVQNQQKNSDYKDLKLKVEYTEDSDQEEGIIVKQNPDGKIKVKKNAEVLLTVSSGKTMIDIPDVKNYKQSDAVTTLERAGFATKIEEQESETVEKGNVIKTDPAAGQKAPKDSTITVYVSSGKKKEPVPSVVGESLESAKSKLQSAGFTIGDISYDNSDSITEGNVISTDPAGGSQAEKGSAVNLVVSEGKAIESVGVEVYLPSGVSGAMNLEAYLNGGLYTTQSVKSSQGVFALELEGQGKQQLKIYLDGQPYADYTINFDNGTVTQTGSYQYTPSGGDDEPTNNGGSGGDYHGYIDPSVNSGDYGNITN